MVTAEIGDQSRSKKPLKNKRFMPRKLSRVEGRSENLGRGALCVEMGFYADISKGFLEKAKTTKSW